MGAHQEFTATTVARLRHAVDAAYRSDPEPYLAMWSRHEPVSLFGALGPAKTGWPGVEVALRWVTSRFSDPDITTDLEVVHVGSDLAYTVGYEHGVLAIDGTRQPVRTRVTHIYRREHGEWRIVHRHGDFAPVDASPSVP
jgi:ketosteroid isomerase-like protein